jgi:hypothetical protein
MAWAAPIGFVLLLSLGACDKTRSPRSVSQEFIDRYYIERDHRRTLELVEGGAAERVKSEQRLLVGTSNSSDTGVLPRVFYNFQKQEPRGEQTELTYNLTVDSSGVELKKQVRITVARFGEQYKVTFFNERDLPARRQQ